MSNLHIFSEENLLKQIEQSEYTLGFYKVFFFSNAGKPADTVTGTLSDFYLYPSGGTLRDKDLNIVFYSSKFDTYRGFIPPVKKQQS